VAGSSEHGNETSHFIKRAGGGIFIDQHSDS
jgi:hypothetical protein